MMRHTASSWGGRFFFSKKKTSPHPCHPKTGFNERERENEEGLSSLLSSLHKKNERSRATRPVVFVALSDDGILLFRRIIDDILRVVESAVLSLFLLFFCLFFFFSSSSSLRRVRTTRTKIQRQQQSIVVHHHHRRSRFFQIWVIETRQ